MVNNHTVSLQAGRTNMHAAGASLVRIAIACRFVVRLWLSHDSANSCLSQEHAIVRLTVEVPLPLDCTVILARCIFEFYSNPFAGLEGGIADKSYPGESTIIELDLLPDDEAHIRLRTSVV